MMRYRRHANYAIAIKRLRFNRVIEELRKRDHANSLAVDDFVRFATSDEGRAVR